MDCVCPRPTALTPIPLTDCAVRIDQVVSLLFQRAGYDFANEAAVETLATWTGLMAAAANTKVIVLPNIYNLVIPASEEVAFGGGTNETPYGRKVYLGENTVNVTAQSWNISTATYEALQKLSCESDASLDEGMVVYLANRYGQIISKLLTGIPISSFRISTPAAEGFNQANKFNISFSLDPDWANGLTYYTPTDFKADKLRPA